MNWERKNDVDETVSANTNSRCWVWRWEVVFFCTSDVWHILGLLFLPMLLLPRHGHERKRNYISIPPTKHGKKREASHQVSCAINCPILCFLIQAKTEVFPVILNFLIVQDGANSDYGSVSSVSVWYITQTQFYCVNLSICQFGTCFLHVAQPLVVIKFSKFHMT